MEAHAEKASKAIAQAEDVLRSALTLTEVDYGVFEPLVEKVRGSSQSFIFIRFATSSARASEDRLWDWHVKVNRRFQKLLRQFREGTGRKKHVERRKAEKYYLSFIKSSTSFYRGFIQRLASMFCDVPQLNHVAKQLHLDILSVERVSVQDENQRSSVLLSSFSSLMRIGDLSRYKETESEQGERNWGPAKGYYLLALSLRPDSGAAYNQLAVMALADQDHLRAVYSLHRAASASRPFPISRDNIRVEFGKLLELELGDGSALSDVSKSTLGVLQDRFLSFHANCHAQPSNFILFSVKAEQLLQLTTLSFEEVEDKALDKLVQKMVMVNIAAEYLALQGMSTDYLQAQQATAFKAGGKEEDSMLLEQQRSCQAFFLLQRFNIMMFTTLLRMLTRELAHNDGTGDLSSASQPERVPGPVARLLPHLRQYSNWLLSNISSLLSPRLASTTKCLDDVWATYIRVLNILVVRFHIADLPHIDYLLEEDEDIAGFAPVADKVRAWRLCHDDGSLKPAFPDSKTQDRSSHVESCFRIKDLVFDAGRLTICKDDLDIAWTPVEFVAGEFRRCQRPTAKAVVPVEQPKPSTPFRSRAHQHANSANGIPSASTPIEVIRDEVTNGQDEQYAQAVPLITAHSISPSPASQDQTQVSVPQPSTTLQPMPVAIASMLSQQSGSSETLLASSRPVSGSVNVMDLVRKLSRHPSDGLSPAVPLSSTRGSDASPHNFHSPFPPTVRESAHILSRPGTGSGSTFTSAAFDQDLLQQEQDIRLRTSQSHLNNSTSWPSSQQELSRLAPHAMINSSTASPWQSPQVRSPMVQTRQLPHAALFGAVGEARHLDVQPQSGQQSS